MKKRNFLLIPILLLGVFLRVYLSYDIPASGDETVSVLQASGKACSYNQFCQQSSDTPILAADILWFLEYSDDCELATVAESMEKAGMHPPLYYFFIHYILKYLGNDTFVIRCVSILFSLGSIVMMYLIGKEFKDDKLGLMAALLLAISVYGIKFSFMIRPYPMVMFITLLSTWVALKWVQKGRFRFSDIHWWAILALSVTGLYSIYHYVFYLAFMWSFLFFKCLFRKKDFVVIICIPVFTGLAFSIWIPELLNQMSVVNKGSYYFNSLSNPIAGIGQLLTINFTKFLPYKPVSTPVVLTFVLVLGLAGLWFFFRQKNGRFFVCSLIIYVLANTTLDLLLKTNTICVHKLAFFLCPISLLFLVAGCRFISECVGRKFSPYPILVAVAVVTSFYALTHIVKTDGPYSGSLLAKLDEEILPDSKQLAVINYPQRRYVLSYAHARPATDFLISFDMSYRDKLASIESLNNYDSVVLLYFDEISGTTPIYQMEEGQRFLETQGYRLKATHIGIENPVIVLEKDAGNEPTQDVPADTEGLRLNSRNHIYSFSRN